MIEIKSMFKLYGHSCDEMDLELKQIFGGSQKQW